LATAGQAAHGAFHFLRFDVWGELSLNGVERSMEDKQNREEFDTGLSKISHEIKAD
jgi:hypothetical protein